jgi:hypothetical protein
MRRATALALLILSAGCDRGLDGPTLHPTSGRVRVGDKPVAGVRMRLQPLGAPKDTPNPHATTGPDGGFALETSGRPGAPEGRYAVTLTWPPPTGFGSPGRAAADRFAGRYANVDRPFGEVTIRSGTNDLGTLVVPEVARPSAPRSNKRGPQP